jgi:hypothetical protein
MMQDMTLGIAMVRPSRRFLNDETMNRDRVLTPSGAASVRGGRRRRVEAAADAAADVLVEPRHRGHGAAGS